VIIFGDVLPLLHFTSFLISVGVIVFLMLRNSRALLNRLCILLILTFALWSFGYCFIHLSESTQAAMFWINFSSIGWGAFSFAAIYFYLALTQKERILRHKPLLVLLALITFFFIYQQWTGHLVASVIQKPWGWAGVWSNSIYSYLYFAYIGISTVICVALTINLLYKAQTPREKRVARLLSITATVSLVLGSVTDVVLPITGQTVVPQLADILVMIWEMGIVLSVTKYGLMSLTPVTASDRIVSTMTDSLMLLDTRGVVKIANRAAVEVMETPENELVGASFESYVLEKTPVKSFLEHILRSGQSATEEFTYVSRSGKHIPVQLSASCIIDNTNTTLGFVVVARDITELKQAQSSLLESEQRFKGLYESEKQSRQELEEEAKSRALFIDILAHELRTPVTPMLVCSGMLKDLIQSQPGDVLKKLSNNIFSSTVNLSTRLEELLELARYARGTFKLNLQPTDVREFIEKLTWRFKPTLDLKKQQLELNLKDAQPAAVIDSSRLEQVIVNLLSNASKFSPVQTRIALNVILEKDHLRVEVQDNGIGISEEDQKYIFVPYHRLQQDTNKYPGTGLGLAVCKQIVEAHGGKIWVSSQQGKGSSFCFDIPLK
jgi:PAS domain S-box-containing protein